MKNRRPLPKRLTGFVVGLATVALFLTSAAPMASAAPFAYVANFGGDTVSVVDAANPSSVAATIRVGTSPSGVAVNAAGTRAYVAIFGDGMSPSTVAVIDTTLIDFRVPSTTPQAAPVVAWVPVGVAPSGVAVNAAGTTVYVANGGVGSISVIDTARNAVTETIQTGGALSGIAVNPAGTRVYVANFADGELFDIDTDPQSPTRVKRILVGPAPGGVAVSPSGTRVYVVNQSPVDPPTNEVFALTVVELDVNYQVTNVGSVRVGADPANVAVSPSGSFVYVTNQGENTVSVILAWRNAVIETVPVGRGPYGVAVDPTGARIFVSNYVDGRRGSVSVIDAATNATSTVQVGAAPLVFGAFAAGAPSATAPSGPSEDELATLKRQVAALEADKLKLTSDLGTANASVRILTTQLADANATITRLTSELNDARATISTYPDLRRQIDTLNGEIVALKRQIATLTTDLNDANLTISSFIRRLMTGRTDANVAEAARDAAQKELASAAARLGSSRDPRLRHAQKDFNAGLKALKDGHFQRAVKEFAEVFESCRRVRRWER